MLRERLLEWRADRSLAHIVPLATLLLIGLLGELFLPQIGFFRDHSELAWWRRRPEYVLLIVEASFISGLLLFFRRHYEFTLSRHIVTGAVMGVIGIAFWILPTHLYDVWGFSENPEGVLKWFGVQERREGFDAKVFSEGSLAYYGIICVRFWRAVVVVSLAEELFWRSFLMRYLLDRDGPRDRFWSLPFGQGSVVSYGVVTLLFVLAHAPVDYCGAFIYGSLAYYLTVKTRSLSAVVVMHAVANLLMGVYALSFHKYGLW